MPRIAISDKTRDSLSQAVDDARRDNLTPKEFVAMAWEVWTESCQAESHAADVDFKQLLRRP